MRALAAMALALLALAGPLAGARGALQVVGVEGELRLFRFETEPWPLEPGLALPDNSRVELDRDAKLRLRFEHYLEFSLAGPARLTVYVVPAPAVGEMEQDRVVLKLDEGALLVDGRFQFGRPADIVLSLPDRSVLLPKDERFVAVVDKGSSSFYRVQARPSPQAFKVAAVGDSQSGSARLGASAPKPEKSPPFPPSLFDALAQPVKVFVLARDFNMDLGLWPRPPVLGPLLTERLARIPGLTVVDGSGSTHFSYRANGALKEGLDPHLKAVARGQGARWLVAGNVVAESLRPNGGERRVQGQAELRLMETDGKDGGLEVARAGRALELAAREAMEAASAEAAGHLEWHLGNLLQGRAHGQVLLKLVLEGATSESLADLRQRLGGMDTVQRVFRRSFANKEASFDLLLRRSLADFDAQWQAWPASAYGYEGLEAGEALRRYRAVPRGQP
jgi:hypothetical protein